MIPYHADGEECTYYSLEDAQVIINTAFSYKSWHTTYCNMLHMMIAECETKEELSNIVYGMALSDEYDNRLVEITGKSSK